MGNKRNKKKGGAPAPPLPRTPVRSRGNPSRNVALALLAAGAGVFLYAIATTRSEPPAASSSQRAAPTTTSARTRAYRFFESAEAAKPLPVTLSPSRFRDPIVAASYTIAQEIPEVLAQQPCLCGCDNPSDDHRSLLDCYADEHAATCMVCVKEAVYASRMTDAGRSPDWIRESILRHEFSTVDLGN